MTTVSVCMATHNGAKWVEHQLRSILEELGPGDEVIVVDDASTDDTVAVIQGLDDSRIRLHRSAVNRGYVQTFEQALAFATGDVLFLADQDDEWIPGRRAALLAALDDAEVVASEVVVLGTDEPLPSPVTRRPWRLARHPEHGLSTRLRMLAGIAPYYGCAMAVRRSALAAVLPFPDFLDESHDLWLAASGTAQRSLTHLHRPTVRRRLHGDNASSERPRGVRAGIRSRLLVLRMLREARRRARAAGALNRSARAETT